jgi:dUTP pyrophosphatase
MANPHVVLIKKLQYLEVAPRLPEYAHSNDACADVFAYLAEPVAIDSGTTVMIPTGLAINPSEDFEVQVRSRSGLATKGIVVANSPGTIDPGYRGEVKVLLRNNSGTTFVVQPGMKIAQLALNKIWFARFQEVTELETTERGVGGFGSTGL